MRKTKSIYMSALYFMILILFSHQSYSNTTLNKGDCNISNYSEKFIGNGIPIGEAKIGDIIGQIHVSFNWTCIVWGKGANTFLYTQNLSRSFKSGKRYYSNVENIELESDITQSRIGAEDNVLQFVFYPGGTGNEAPIDGSFDGVLFNLIKTGKVSLDIDHNFKFKTRYPFTLSKTYYTSSTSGLVSYQSMMDSIIVPIYDSTCSINYTPNQNIGRLIKGREVLHNFNIQLSCNSPITLQGNINWTFSAGGNNVITSNDKSFAVYKGTNLPTVVMSIESLRNDSSYGDLLYDNVYSFSNLTDANFHFPLRAKFSAGNDSESGIFSFKLNFVVDYN